MIWIERVEFYDDLVWLVAADRGYDVHNSDSLISGEEFCKAAEETDRLLDLWHLAGAAWQEKLTSLSEPIREMLRRAPPELFGQSSPVA